MRSRLVALPKAGQKNRIHQATAFGGTASVPPYGPTWLIRRIRAYGLDVDLHQLVPRAPIAAFGQSTAAKSNPCASQSVPKHITSAASVPCGFNLWKALPKASHSNTPNGRAANKKDATARSKLRSAQCALLAAVRVPATYTHSATTAMIRARRVISFLATF